MLPPSSLQIPKPTGRSRFSKALPAIPGLDTSSPELPSVPATLSSSSTSTAPVSTASVVRSSDGTAYSAPDYPPNKTQVHTAPTQPAPSSTRHEGNSAGVPQGRNLTRQPMPMGHSTISSQPQPPPPSKDDGTVQRPSSPAQPLNGEPKLGAPSPPRQQIWQRRSLKGSRELPDLRLNHSHGSTASTSTISTITAAQKPQPPPKSPPPPALAEKSTTNTVDSPARGKAPDQRAKEHRTMGQVTSKLDRLRNKFHSPHASKDSTKSAKSDQTAPSVKRPPTPEYQKEDRKADDLNTFVSPVSPASSPEPANKTASDAPTTVSEQMPSGSCPDELRPRARKAAPVPTPAPTLQPVKSLPDLKTNVPPPTSTEPLPPASAFPSSGRNSPAFDMAPRGRQPGPPGAYPPSSRNTSARPSSRGSVRPGVGPRFPPPESDPRLVRSPSGEFMYKGRDGTLYPEMKENPNPDPRAARFPKQCEELPTPGAVFKAVPLKTSHFECYQRHKNMLRRPNRRYPLACQTCRKQDSDDRFSCSFCYVRMCESCLRLFETKQRDLRALVDELSSSGTLSLSSPTRPGSALGLQINF
ncbi:hypothetical protein ACRE_010820 [Hapsidospora chrysogenum ATCC 11550]|uniref:Uncharacterized protein n=1 Tax=Hapsidospora chrysogenum (strain ATCC 11550 / CBS 779.69 / DSM 880 / IAM 14645 / JCM 23072 / IMI 49137) TaxID=857340 RepID=A0A086TFM9_HAPC1|nr:hypothetical protein ACRE_010820 [Hapsidospora chrysogenum ATCC 11550]